MEKRELGIATIHRSYVSLERVDNNQNLIKNWISLGYMWGILTYVLYD